MTAAAFEATSCPRGRNEIYKLKSQFNASPAAGINTLCAPSMGEGIERYRIISEGVNPLQASWRSLLVPLKSWIVSWKQRAVSTTEVSRSNEGLNVELFQML